MIIFLNLYSLSAVLTYTCRVDSSCQDREFLLACKRRVVQFVHRWVTAIGDPVFEEQITHSFLQVIII